MFKYLIFLLLVVVYSCGSNSFYSQSKMDISGTAADSVDLKELFVEDTEVIKSISTLNKNQALLYTNKNIYMMDVEEFSLKLFRHNNLICKVISDNNVLIQSEDTNCVIKTSTNRIINIPATRSEVYGFIDKGYFVYYISYKGTYSYNIRDTKVVAFRPIDENEYPWEYICTLGNKLVIYSLGEIKSISVNSSGLILQEIKERDKKLSDNFTIVQNDGDNLICLDNQSGNFVSFSLDFSTQQPLNVLDNSGLFRKLRLFEEGNFKFSFVRKEDHLILLVFANQTIYPFDVVKR